MLCTVDCHYEGIQQQENTEKIFLKKRDLCGFETLNKNEKKFNWGIVCAYKRLCPAILSENIFS